MANRPVYMAGSGKLLCLRESGDVVGFTFEGETFPTLPRTFFYDWLYIHALTQHPELAEELVKYDAFTGIVFTPEKSVNCQAAAAATYVSLYRKGLLEQATASKAVFLRIVYELELPVPAPHPGPRSSVPSAPEPQRMRLAGKCRRSISSFPRPLMRETTTVSGPMQGMALITAASSWVALVTKMTMSMMPISSAVYAVLNPLR